MTDSYLSIHHPEWLTELRSAAEAATPGPWGLKRLSSMEQEADDEFQRWLLTAPGNKAAGVFIDHETDVAYIASADPSRVLWLTTLLADMADTFQVMSREDGEVTDEDIHELLARFEKGPS